MVVVVVVGVVVDVVVVVVVVVVDVVVDEGVDSGVDSGVVELVVVDGVVTVGVESVAESVVEFGWLARNSSIPSKPILPLGSDISTIASRITNDAPPIELITVTPLLLSLIHI